jgi:uncharacterized RDD family membrane protein YckC
MSRHQTDAAALQYGRAVAVPQYASLWRRGGAAIIDGLILQIGISALLGVSLAATRSITITLLAWLVITWIYFSRMESSSLQATLGKMAAGLRVTDLAGNRISVNRATGRFFARVAWMQLPIIAAVAWVLADTFSYMHSGATQQQIEGYGWGAACLAGAIMIGGSIALLLIYALTVAISPRKQAFHDMASGCVVVHP